jgi:hypothetical protein
MKKAEFIKKFSKIEDTLEDEFRAEFNSPELIWEALKKQLRIASVSNRYFVFSGQEDNKPTKYLVDDCKDRETAIAKIETEYPNFKWVMTETFNGC